MINNYPVLFMVIKMAFLHRKATEIFKNYIRQGPALANYLMIITNTVHAFVIKNVIISSCTVCFVQRSIAIYTDNLTLNSFAHLIIEFQISVHIHVHSIHVHLVMCTLIS